MGIFYNKDKMIENAQMNTMALLTHS